MRKRRRPLLISVVGTSGSGKTTTIEYLTSDLTRLGFRVGVAKHIHKEGFSIDTKGKDTWRHARAGAALVVGVSPNEFAVIRKTSKEARFEEVQRVVGGYDLDVVILEGFSTALPRGLKVYKILAAKNGPDLDYTAAKTPSPILAVTGRVVKSCRGTRNLPAPFLDLPRQRAQITMMVRQLLGPKGG